MSKTSPDNVNSPSHYNSGAIECIDAIQASMTITEFWGYLKGNSIKYLWRYRYKGHMVQDLEKSVWYTTKLIEAIKQNEEVVKQNYENSK